MSTFDSDRRDPLLDETVFFKKRDFFETKVRNDSKALEILNSSDDAEQKERVSWDRVVRFLEHSLCGYSGGIDLVKVEGEFTQFIDCLIFHKKSFRHTQLKYWEPDAYQYILWIYSISILLGKKEFILPVVEMISKNPQGEDDPILSIFLARMGVIGFPRQRDESLAFPKSYQHLYDAIKGDGVSPTKAERQESIKQYLKGWYKGMKDCYWYNRHKGQFPTFFGYWAFEAGMVTLLYGLDDSSYRHMLYYPKDLVDHARAQGYDQLFAPELMEQQKHYIVLPGDECSIDGTFLCNLTNDQIILNRGDRAPGPIEDENGNRIFWVSQ
ncbi:PoNi-like cognate immunity protein [Vibrio spartinae]|uniref:PoNi C-terminal domain-containing protein n=1 Tax=Vibrio spartinae TaxID=1918945 RepID=A0A1N6LZB2_9VIBR|nr:PoNi-like cognate immunity protein [Vibrio spartinae]SIO92522.1 hypothetical protein VSP9026_00135 [Vibrio spartinae]